MQTTYTIPHLPEISGARVAILQAKWYSDITDMLIEKCLQVLTQANCTHIEKHILPGSLELPLAAQTLILSAPEKYDAIICVGGIVKGETLHFEMIADECIRGFGRVMLDHNVPLIVEVLPVFDLEHLRVRCQDDENNKGYEAGMAAVEMIAWRRKVMAS